jgi:hypothetical protein
MGQISVARSHRTERGPFAQGHMAHSHIGYRSWWASWNAGRPHWAPALACAVYGMVR